jgi:hypothetical protein
LIIYFFDNVPAAKPHLSENTISGYIAKSES